MGERKTGNIYNEEKEYLEYVKESLESKKRV